VRSLPLLLALAAVCACSDEAGPAGPLPGPEVDCLPDRAAWDDEVAPLLRDHCGGCHQAEPRFGAPFTLLDYDANVAGVEGERRVDWIVEQLMAHTMPPPGAPRPPHDALVAITEWASCGDQTPDEAGGLTVSAPPIRSDRESPDLPYFDVLAGQDGAGFPVPAVDDLYQCFSVDVPTDEERFARRFEVVIDDARVLHHAVLLRDNEGTAPDGAFGCPGMPRGSDYLFAWAPGQTALEFPAGGLRIRPGERLVLQIHYNNRAAHEGVMDESGVRIFHDAPSSPEYGMIAVGPIGFSIPARTTADASSACTLPPGTEVYASMPHMHEIGEAFRSEIETADGMEPLIELSGWDFETQLGYHTPRVLEEGERIVTTCTFDNPLDRTVWNGEATDDEMCFNFMYVTPPPTERYCDESLVPPVMLDYTPNECAPEEMITELETVQGSLDVGPPEAWRRDSPEVPEGRYRLARTDFYLETLETPVGILDTEASTVDSVGQLVVAEGELTLDVDLQFAAVHESGFAFEDDDEISFGGVVETDGHTLSLNVRCPGEDLGSLYSFRYDVQPLEEGGGDAVLLQIRTGGPTGTTWIRLRFEPE